MEVPFISSARWVCLVFIAYAGPAAAGIAMSDLYGYSVNAEWTIQETETNSRQPKPYISTKHFADKIYLSTKGRLFFAGSKVINKEDRGPYAWLNSNLEDPVVYQPGEGFIIRGIEGQCARNSVVNLPQKCQPRTLPLLGTSMPKAAPHASLAGVKAKGAVWTAPPNRLSRLDDPRGIAAGFVQGIARRGVGRAG